MEASPLTKAHDHARTAAVAQRTADTTVAINAHTLAAGEFSNAAQTTASVEALRMLRLLEQHHKKLSELLQSPVEQTSQRSDPDGASAEGEEKLPIVDEAGEDAEKTGEKSKAEGKTPITAATNAPKSFPTLAQQRRYPGRDFSSSIASNLASARGIKSKYRGQPLTPSVSNDQAPGSFDITLRRERSGKTGGESRNKPSWVPPTQPSTTPIKTETKAANPSPAVEPSNPTANDDGFSRFYSTFGSFFNRLSAPLAFAGLPLITEEAAAEPVPSTSSETSSSHKRSRHRASSTASVEPDLSKIYSRATLRALAKDSHGPNDSFYVVPTAGGTVSYANILSFDQKERRRQAVHSGGDGNEGADDPDEDDFVDARAFQGSSGSASGGPVSPALRKRIGRGVSDKDMQNVVEELFLENKSLKEALDKLSKRLHAFELNSQSSHLALAQSLRLQRPGSPLSTLSSSGGGGGGGSGGGRTDPAADEVLKKRNRELEGQLALMGRQMEALERENQKNQGTIEKYRDRWEKLKAGAKARREAQGGGENGGGESFQG